MIDGSRTCADVRRSLRARSLYETLGFRTVRSTRRSRLIVP